ncbi:hypothetical protein ACYSNO_05245 [Enterococcus sp. LJL98]
MKRMKKVAIAAGIFFAATITSASVFAASDLSGQTNDSNEERQENTWKENRQSHMQEQVEAGYLTQEEADEMTDWMDHREGSCHGNRQNHSMNNQKNENTGTGSHHRGMGGQHHRMWRE